jgi:hypothetical protein
MYYHANIEHQIQEILMRVKVMKYKECENDNEIRDFMDGTIYKNLIKSEDGNLFKKNEAFSLTLNTDGISVCNKSRITIRPFYFSINEIPKEERYLIENMIIAGECEI